MIQFDYSSLDLFKGKKKYKLSSVLGEDNFFYGLFDPENEKLLKAKYLTDLPKYFFQDDDYLSSFFAEENLDEKMVSEAVFAMAQAPFSLLPEHINPQDSDLYKATFADWHIDDPKQQMQVQYLLNNAANLYFFSPANLPAFLTARFGVAKIVHLNGALIEGMKELGLEDALMVNALNRSIQTVVMRRGKLMQSNYYTLEGEDDALYFALLNAKNHDLDPLKDAFYYAGPLPVEGTYLSDFHQHIQHFEPLKISDRLQYANVFLGKSKALFYDLQAVLSCAS
jgi:hypothetical protein